MRIEVAALAAFVRHFRHEGSEDELLATARLLGPPGDNDRWQGDDLSKPVHSRPPIPLLLSDVVQWAAHIPGAGEMSAADLREVTVLGAAIESTLGELAAEVAELTVSETPVRPLEFRVSGASAATTSASGSIDVTWYVVDSGVDAYRLCPSARIGMSRSTHVRRRSLIVSSIQWTGLRASWWGCCVLQSPGKQQPWPASMMSFLGRADKRGQAMNSVIVYLEPSMTQPEIKKRIHSVAAVVGERVYFHVAQRSDSYSVPVAPLDLFNRVANEGWTPVVIEYSGGLQTVKDAVQRLTFEVQAVVDNDHDELMTSTEFVELLESDPMWDWRK